LISIIGFISKIDFNDVTVLILPIFGHEYLRFRFVSQTLGIDFDL